MDGFITSAHQKAIRPAHQWVSNSSPQVSVLRRVGVSHSVVKVNGKKLGRRMREVGLDYTL